MARLTRWWYYVLCYPSGQPVRYRAVHEAANCAAVTGEGHEFRRIGAKRAQVLLTDAFPYAAGWWLCRRCSGMK
jgi:hypothetical protein